MDKQVSMVKCQRTLALAWYVLSVPAFVVLVAQTIGDTWSPKEPQLWGWFLPTILPTLVLITGAVVFGEVQAARHKRPSKTVPVFARNVALGMSVFYLLAVNAVVFSTPATKWSLDALEKSGTFLAPLQGLVGAALAVFFGTSKDEKRGKGDS